MKQPFERLLVGRTLAGRYRVDEVIGAGGMSVVFHGHDLTLGRPVAVKVVSLAADSEGMRDNLRERFRREAGSAARIPHHPNVVQVYDYGTDTELDLDFIVMELLLGHDLKEHLARGAPPLPEALRIIREAGRGVAAGHRAGIIHRDVKPANVFLAGETQVESVRVLDFGIAKPLQSEGEDSLTTIGQTPHSPAYASPEQTDPDMPVDASSDVYQLGLVAYETLTGERPFSPTDRENQRAGEDVPLRPTTRWTAVPVGVREVIARALRPNPAERYPDGTAFVDAFVDAETEGTMLHIPAADPVVATVEPVAVVRPEPEPEPFVAPVVIEPEPVRSDPTILAEEPVRGIPVRSGGGTKGRNPLMLVVPLVLLAVLGLWALTRGDDTPDPTGPLADATEPVRPDSAAFNQLNETFTALQGEAARRQPATPIAAANGGAAVVPGGVPAATTPGANTENVLEAARKEIEAGVRDLNRAWVEGDLSRHVSHYASRVDYYNSSRLPRAGVRRDRGRDMRRYEVDRQIVFHSLRVEFLQPDEARILVDKEWLFQSKTGIRRGRGLQEYIMKRDEDDGKWYVTRENLLRRSESQTPTLTPTGA
ncbi:MAG TPA: serine/threonine-protein kinase [Longimicrobium sp.]|nr:serine/threonine-protein kinase [Longimicrobium sp.]